MTIREYEQNDLKQMTAIWNEVVEEGTAFPQEEPLDDKSAKEFFASQSCCGVAVDDDGTLCGLYILHPNNVGRCGHICNASYAVDSKIRGKHIGEKLVLDCIKRARSLGFLVLQFNAVVETNIHAKNSSSWFSEVSCFVLIYIAYGGAVDFFAAAFFEHFRTFGEGVAGGYYVVYEQNLFALELVFIYRSVNALDVLSALAAL